MTFLNTFKSIDEHLASIEQRLQEIEDEAQKRSICAYRKQSLLEHGVQGFAMGFGFGLCVSAVAIAVYAVHVLSFYGS